MKTFGKKKIAEITILLVFALTVVHTGCAQGILDSVAQDESKIVAAIAPYPPDMRAAILDVSQYPQTLAKLKRVQTRTSREFQEIIAGYPREEQEKFYQLSRFPELVTQLLNLGSGKTDDVTAIIKDYPVGAQPAIKDVYQNHFNDLSRINTLWESGQNVLDRIASKHSSLVQDDLKKVIGSPDVMSLLTDDIDLTISLGETYKEDPERIVNYLDSLNAEITRQGAKDLEDYKAAVAADPKLQEEMKKAADEFATEFNQAPNVVTSNNNYYGSAPYPYWFGYPYWYAGPMWYPTPFYYNTGFYYGVGGNMVVFGLPSYAYANWFFGRGYSHYPGLYNHYHTYYNVHRTEITNNNVYRGFNTATRDHFNNVGRVVNPPQQPGTTMRHRSTGGARSTSSMPTRSYNQPMNNVYFNNRGFTHYNANSYHSMGWGGMRGGMRGPR